MSDNQQDNTNNDNTNNDGFRDIRGRRPQQPHNNRQQVLQRVAQGYIQPDEAEKMLRTRLPPRFVVTRTGAIALYNLKRDPVVLYADQWEKLSSLIERGILKNYMGRNESIIKRRPRMPSEQSSEQPIPPKIQQLGQDEESGSKGETEVVKE